MNTHDIELPPLPEHDMCGEAYAYSNDAMEAYARAAVEPYAKRIAELEAQNESDRQRRGEPVGDVFTMEALDGSGDVRSHVLLNKPLPAGTKLYAAPVAAHPDHSEQDLNMDKQVIQDILAERELQVQTGYDSDHDDEHVLGEIAAMAAYYMLPPAVRDWPASETGYGDTFGEALLPEGWQASPHHSRRVELVRAVAMGLAEIERIDRAAAPTPPAAGQAQQESQP